MSQVPEDTEGLGPQQRVCGARDCEAVFTPAWNKPKQRFHDGKCKDREGRALLRDARDAEERERVELPPHAASQAALDKDAKSREQREKSALDRALAASRERDEQQAHKLELRKLTAQEERLRRYEAILRESLDAFEPTPLVIDIVPADTEMPEQVHVLAIGDWHTGAKVQLHETGGMYEQTIATTKGQIEDLWLKIKRLHAVQSSGSVIRKLVIISLGDLVDNDDMRPAQHRNVEEVVTVQTMDSFGILSWLVRQCLTIYETVEIDLVGGNHDRTGRNRGNAGLGELDYIDTYSWMIGEMAKNQFVNEPRVKIINWNTFFGYKMVEGQRIIFEHGASFKWNTGGYGGVPWYAVSQLPRKFAEMLGHADLTIIGHGHRPAILPAGRGWMILNGALPGTTLYEQSSFKSIHRPLQTLLTLHREHGLTSWQPIYLDVANTVLPGEIWTDPEGYAEMANRRPGYPLEMPTIDDVQEAA